MKFLIVARQKKNVDSFRTTIARLLEQGHAVRLGLQDRDAGRDARVAEGFDSPLFSLEGAPTARGDDWRTQAPLVRRIRDWLQYLGPEYRGAHKLRMRVVDRLRAELGVSNAAFGDGLVADLAASQVERLGETVARTEEGIPSDPLHEEFIGRVRPDVVLVTPGVHFGSAQADFIKSARAMGIPVWMLVFSWDNLSTKGALHVPPDLMFVWNERQRAEAQALHRFPPDRVIVVGAPRFDEFFDMKPALSRGRFLGPLRLDAEAPTLLYLCSSRFVAKHELGFVRKWIAAIRSSSDPALRRANIIVRPHPDIPLFEDDDPEIVVWPELPRAQGWVSRPFSDDRAVVLRTTYATQQALFECLYHSAACVGLNTSAELEAGIVGRPVFTVLADDEAVTGQAGTLHFHYLLRENGGLVESAPDLDTHVRQLEESLGPAATSGPVARGLQPTRDPSIHAFVREFLRPRGDRRVSDVLAEELITQARSGAASALGRPAGVGTDSLYVVSGFSRTGTLSESSSKVLRLGYSGSSLRVRATHETRKRRSEGELALDPDTVAWLDAQVQPNDVVYDIGAGIGEYSLIAATHRNALAFAFEPGFATFKRLCENILFNDCRQTVVPLPLAAGDRAGLLELEYPENAAGEDRHRLKPAQWRRRPYDAESNYVQPVCVDRLDEIVTRHGLPRPMHIRLNVPRWADAVVRGAPQTLADPGLKSVLIIAPRREIRAVVEELIGASGLSLVPPPRRTEQFQRLLFVREPAAMRNRA